MAAGRRSSTASGRGPAGGSCSTGGTRRGFAAVGGRRAFGTARTLARSRVKAPHRALRRTPCPGLCRTFRPGFRCRPGPRLRRPLGPRFARGPTRRLTESSGRLAFEVSLRPAVKALARGLFVGSGRLAVECPLGPAFKALAGSRTERHGRRPVKAPLRVVLALEGGALGVLAVG